MEKFTPRWGTKSFVVFVVLMLLLIGVLMWAPWREDKANASTARIRWGCWDKTERVDDGGGWALWSRAKWCGLYESGSEGNRGGHFVDGNDSGTNPYPNWSRGYAEGLYTFSKWLPERNRFWTGFGIAPDGSPDMEYATRTVWAEFELCFADPWVPCLHYTRGIKHQVWANGQDRSWKLTDR